MSTYSCNSCGRPLQYDDEECSVCKELYANNGEKLSKVFGEPKPSDVKVKYSSVEDISASSLFGITQCVVCHSVGVWHRKLCSTCEAKAETILIEYSKMFRYHKVNVDLQTEKSILNLGISAEAAEILATFVPAFSNLVSFLNKLFIAVLAVKESGFQADTWKKDLALNLNIPEDKVLKECYDSMYYPLQLAHALGYDLAELLQIGNQKNEEKYGKAGGYYAKNVDKETAE